MAGTPNPKSPFQIFGDMIASYISSVGVNDLNTGSAVTSFFEAFSQAVYRASADNFSILREYNVDRASGSWLKKIADEENVKYSKAVVTIGKVTIRDSSFEKISTKIYAGANPPNIGSTSIFVSDASLFSATGTLYIGRGTPNIEGPLSYNNVIQVGGFWRIDLTSPTTKFHNISESVVLGQGGVRTVAVGTIVKAPASGLSPDITFTLGQQAVLLDGENFISGISVAASTPGADSNVPRGAIKTFNSPPFVGAIVSNDSPFNTGKNADSDDEIRAKIKRARLSRGLGTAIAVKSSVIGAKASDENAVVTSSEIFSDSDTTVLYIDNSQGYEEKSLGVGIESIVDSALGGEYTFQLATGGRQTSVAKAFLVSSLESPFNISGNDRLSLLVGGVLSEHVFKVSDIKSAGNATAYEVAASINADSTISYSASTIESGKRVVLYAKAEVNEYIQKTVPTVSNDAGVALGLPSNEVQTLRLYRNKKPISKNGRLASVQSAPQADWSNTLVTGETLIVSVDNTSAITYTFTDADFLAEGTHPTLNKNNTLASWVNVINSKVTGLTASVNGTGVVISSNLGQNSRGSINIDLTSTLVTKGVFTEQIGLSAIGLEADYKMSRNTAQITLLKPLEAGDSLSAGTEFTKGEVQNEPILGGTVAVSDDAYLWLLIDNKDAEYINTGVTADTIINITKPSANIVRYTSSATGAFQNVQIGDYLIIWSEELLPSNRLEGRVYDVGGEYVELYVTASEYAAASIEGPIIWSEGIAVVRTENAVQKVKVEAGAYNINTVASILSEGIVGATVSTEDDQYLNITTSTEEANGEVFIITFNETAKVLNFSENTRNSSEFSLFAFYESEASDGDFPLFVHSAISSDELADPPNTFITSFDSAVNLAANDVDPNVLVEMLYPYGVIKDNAADNEQVQVVGYPDSTQVDVTENKFIRRLRINDRFFIADYFQFGGEDSLVVILDSDPSNKTFPIPLYRKATINNTMGINANNFRAYDVDSGATTEFSQFFGANFNFDNFKVLMKAKNVIDPSSSTDEDAVLFRSVEYGTSGELVNVGYSYPTSVGQGITHSVMVADKVRVKIFLKSGNEVINTIDGTTEWDITITNMGAYDEVTYTWNSTGTNPTIAASLSSGGYASINSSGEFSIENTGIFRVSSATANSFTVIREAGAAITESNIATLTDSTITLYLPSDTTAQEVVDYVTANLADYLTAAIVDDNGDTGAGVIDRSTSEDSDFTLDGVDLLDGLNWIEDTDLSAAAPNYQFRFKETLDLPSYSTNTANAYAFNAGEEIRLIPTTSKQIVDFINVLAVSGISTLGRVDAVLRDRKIQIKTNIIGSNGSVLVAGGRANSTLAQVSASASRVNGVDLTRVTINRSAAGGFVSKQWVKMSALRAQKKDTGISFATTVDITPNSPILGKSSITLNNRESADLYFGEPKSFFRDNGRTFEVEKHGKLVCVAWDGQGASPVFSKAVAIGGTGGDITVNYNTDTGYTEYTADASISFQEAKRGDTFVIDGLINEVNNGSFRVIGVSDDGQTLVTDNTMGVNATIETLAASSFEITATIQEGDTVILDAPFSNLNRGTFRVIRTFADSFYIENENAIEEIVTIAQAAIDMGYDGTTEFDATNTNGVVRVEWNGNGLQPDFSEISLGTVVTLGTDFSAGNQGSFQVTNVGSDYFEFDSITGVTEAGIVITDILSAYNPAIRFYEYDVTVAGDRIIISGDVLGENNIGEYTIESVVNKNTVIINQIMATVSGQALEDDFTQLYIEESLKFTAYKKVYGIAVDPSNTNRSVVTFEGSNQYLKINRDAGEVSFSAIGKMNFSTVAKLGEDSYKYNTGLIGESNRVVYGDPRDNVVYPGVSAAGAEIFIRSPLVRRIVVGIGVRLNTGIPFNKIVEQVRNNVAALINSNPIGEAIAISNIVSVVNSIPGVKAISITSPSYDASNDVIVVGPAEKALILDIVNDISVSKVG